MSPSASASPRPAGPAGFLLGADQIPAFGGVRGWSTQATGPAGAAPFGACQPYDFATIGARSAILRRYARLSGPSATTAAERVVSFPDAANAARADQVLKSFRAHCQARLRTQLPHLRVSTAHDISGDGEHGWSYALTWAPDHSTARHTEEIGTMRHGSRIAVVTFRYDGPALRADRDPMPGAVIALFELFRGA